MYQDPYTISGAPSRCPDIDPEYMLFERLGNIIVGPPSVGTWAVS
jgi:hypothetical protein